MISSVRIATLPRLPTTIRTKSDAVRRGGMNSTSVASPSLVSNSVSSSLSDLSLRALFNMLISFDIVFFIKVEKPNEINDKILSPTGC